MFNDSNFNKPIGDWDVSNVTILTGMFRNSKFNQDISNWDVTNVKRMDNMFANSSFNKDISSWNIRKDCDIKMMFNGCDIRDEFKPVF